MKHRRFNDVLIVEANAKIHDNFFPSWNLFWDLSWKNGKCKL